MTGIYGVPGSCKKNTMKISKTGHKHEKSSLQKQTLRLTQLNNKQNCPSITEWQMVKKQNAC